MSHNEKPIPLYSSDGRCVAWRSLEDAQYRVAAGFCRPSYGRKGHLKAVWLLRDDRTSPVEAQVAAGTRYSYLERLDCGRRCWKLRDVTAPSGYFFQLLTSCLVESTPRQHTNRDDEPMIADRRENR